MPSSFTQVLSSALVFSTRPPVSVWGTVPFDLKLRSFSWKHGINHFCSVEHRHQFSALWNRICLIPPAYYLKHGQPSPCWPSLLRHSVAVKGRYRNIDLFPIDYVFRPHLRGRLTLRRLALRRNPWSFGEGGSHSLYRYSCQHSHF